MNQIVLSSYQEAVIEFVKNGTGNLVISAVAGSGKSFTIIYASQFIPKSASSIFLAFNKHIVKELKGRLPPNVEARTCHSLGYGPCINNSPGRRLLVDGKDPHTYQVRDKYGNLCSWAIETHFSKLDWEQKKGLSRQLNKLVDFARNTLSETDVESLRRMATEYNIEIKEDKLYELVPQLLNEGIQIYKQTGEIDFTDMIWLPIVLNMSLRKFDYILVDEFQDLNKLQHELLFRSCHPKTRMFVVGDAIQSMYKFTGAVTGSMDVFRERANATQLPLSICYRCPKSHIRIARFFDGDRTEPSPYAEEGVVEFILGEDIFKLVQPKDIIGCRLTAPLLKTCIRLISKGMAAKVLGRNIGKKLEEHIVAAMRPGDELIPLDWNEFPMHLDQLESGIKAKLSKLKNGEAQIETFMDEIDAIRACYASPNFNTSDQKTFTKQLLDLFSEDQSPITLATVHRLKGLEADNIFVICDNNEKDVMPLVWKNQQLDDLEQEINIGYVAVTRAKKALRFCSASKEASQRHKYKYEQGGIVGEFVSKLRRKKPVSVTETIIPDVHNKETGEIADFKLTEPKKKKKIKKKVKKQPKKYYLDV